MANIINVVIMVFLKYVYQLPLGFKLIKISQYYLVITVKK